MAPVLSAASSLTRPRARTNPENVRLFPGVGMLLSLFYVICLSYSELLVAVTERLDEVTFIWFDLSCFFMVFVPTLMIQGHNPWVPSVKDRLLLFLGGISEVICHVFIIVAVIKAPFGDVTTIWSTCIVLVPVCECVLAPITRPKDSKRCPSNLPLQILFTTMAIIGVIFVTKPSFIFKSDDVQPKSYNQYIGYLCAIGNAFCVTSNYIIVDQLDHIKWAIVDFWFVPATLLILPPLTFFFNGFQFPTTALPLDYVAAIVSGLLDVTACIFCTLSQKVVNASAVTLVSTLEIPLSYFLDFIFKGAIPSWSTIGGAALVMAAVVGATLHTILLQIKPQGEVSIQRKRDRDGERDPLLRCLDDEESGKPVDTVEKEECGEIQSAKPDYE